MKRSWLLSAAALLGMSLASVNAFAADPAPTKESKPEVRKSLKERLERNAKKVPAESAKGDPAKSETKTTAAKDKQPRLPDHFAKLNLTSDQEAKIRQAIQQHGKKIAELRKQLVAAQEARDAAAESFLTADQKSALAEARKSAGDGKDARAEAKSDAKPEAKAAAKSTGDAPAKKRRKRAE